MVFWNSLDLPDPGQHKNQQAGKYQQEQRNARQGRQMCFIRTGPDRFTPQHPLYGWKAGKEPHRGEDAYCDHQWVRTFPRCENATNNRHHARDKYSGSSSQTHFPHW